MPLSAWWQSATPAERNRFIAQRVMKDKRKRPYTTSIRAAWLVVGRMNRPITSGNTYGQQARFAGIMQLEHNVWYGDGARVAEKICLAACAAVGIDEVDKKGE